MITPVIAALEQLNHARGEDLDATRAELRDEVRITALLLIAHELETIANAVHQTMRALDTAIQAHANTDQLTLPDIGTRAED